jgi:hypothetical protein
MLPAKPRSAFEEETSLGGLAFVEVAITFGRGGSGGRVSVSRSLHREKLEKTDIEEDEWYKFSQNRRLETLNWRKKRCLKFIMCAGVEPSSDKQRGRREVKRLVMNISILRAYFQQGELSETRH